MSQVKSITTRSGILFIGKIIDAFFMFMFNFLAAKYIGAEGYGTYVYISTLVMFLSIAIKMGMDHGLTALIPGMKDINQEKELVSFSVYFLLGISVVLGLIFFVSSEFVSRTLLNNVHLESALRLFLPLIFPIAFVQMSEGIFRTIGGIKHFFFSKNILMPISLVAFFLVRVIMFDENTLETLIYSNYFAWSLNVAYLLGILIHRKILVFLKYENKVLYKRLLVISIPLILVGLIEFLMGRIDAYVIGYQLTESDVGVYSIVDKLAYIGNFMFIAGGSMMAPVLARYYSEKDFKNLKQTYFDVNRWILMINTAVFGGLILLGHEVLALFGPEFIIGDRVLYALAFAQLINAFFGPLTFLNAMVGLEKIEWRIGFSMLLVNGILDILVVKTYGIIGIAYVSVLIYLIGNLIRMQWFKRAFGVSLIALNGLKVIAVGILAYLPMKWLLEHNPFTGFLSTFILFGMGFMVLYLILVWIIVLSREDKVTICKAITKKQIQ
ncbi:oligosaccharide flippase family protein [Fusibacter ferrireducens]|uniref:Oligosaccharide flippase family protein n=1 Tax=Fusibacter ferrireducens TaxID=2785058 RepID=A0ABR9ZXB2_9FIRM|nr:oligosaccharide flippase family protein [Fusibacter ferrireducens]MBF4695109.1 oligosaccharide flippase family protein [Fusibacter ferrireducens]